MKRLAFALCLLALPSAALADGDYRWELTPQISYHFGGELNAETNGPIDADLELDNGAAIGLTFDIPLSNNLQIELLLNYQETDLFFDGGIFGPDIRTTEAEIAYAHVGLLAQFGRADVTPYFVISGGLTRIDPNFGNAGTDDLFSMSLGGGVKLFFTPWFGLRLEGRAFFTYLDSYEFSCNNSFDNVCYDYNDYLTQTQITAGFIFAW